MEEIKNLLATEDLAALELQISEVNNSGKSFVDKKMPHIDDILPTAKPMDPYKEAIQNIRQFIQDNDLATFNKEIREVQAFNRTTETVDGVKIEDVLEVSGEITGINDLYRAFNGKDPFTGEKLSFVKWTESVGWSILTVVPPAYLVRGAGKVGKAAKGVAPLKGIKALSVEERMTKLGEVAKLSARGTLKKGKDFTSAELDRAAQKLNDALDKLNMTNGYSPSLPGAGGMEVRLADNQFSSFHSGKTGGGKPLNKIDGIKIVDGKVGGKIPIDDYHQLREASIHNVHSDSLTLGKYTPSIENGAQNWNKAGPDSYIAKAGKDSTYFDMGKDWDVVKKKYNLTDDDMFELLNVPVLDEAIIAKKTIYFSHNPNGDKGFLGQEFEYLLKNGYTRLKIKNGNYYVEPKQK